jgi:hypothetical protein
MRLSQARALLHHSRDLAESVLRGVTPFDDALATIKEEQQRFSSTAAKLERIQAAAPDLADRIADEKLSIVEANAIWMERELCPRQVG